MQIMKFTYHLFPNWIRSITHRVPDHRIQAKCSYSMEQVVFSGLMMFIMRYRSLRSYSIENKGNPFAIKNFQRWITISDIPSDDEFRYCMQTVSTNSLNLLLKDFHQTIERKKLLVDEKLFNRFELVTLDGTGQLCSKKISCEQCLTKTLENGEVQFCHGQLLASITNVKAGYALPLQFEPIQRGDTETAYTKNDCELNAGKRLICKLRTQFPKRNFCFLADNLFAVEPIISLIQERNWHFIITAKPDRNKEVFFMFDYLHEQKRSLDFVDKDGSTHTYRWSNGLALKQFSKNEKIILVNLIEYQEISSEGELVYKSAWITDFEVTKDNVRTLATAGRARFVIENRNFNEQKNLGFQTEHNFGHFGNLPNVFFGLAQIAQLITELFSFWNKGKGWIEASGSKRRYFERLAVVIGELVLPDDDSQLLYLKFDFNSS